MPLRADAIRRRATPIAAALLLASFAAVHAGAGPAAPQNASGQSKAPTARKGLVKLSEPWPDDEVIRQRHADAENRPLFQSADPLTLTLTANFNAVNKDRDENSTKRFPATLLVTGDPARSRPIAVNLGTRGHFRLRRSSCSFVPLRVEFDRQVIVGTVFDGQNALKLVTHCRDHKDYEQYVLREYLVYKIFNLLTPRSFRVRLTKATYADSASSKGPTTRYGMFIEDDDDVAWRLDGRVAELYNVSFKELDSESQTLMFLFEYMIASTDLSIIKLHNVRLVQDRARVLYPVPYDFDLAGLVDTSYGLADERLGIASTRDRLYRGPCRTQAELEPALEKFRAIKDAVMALYDSLPDLDPAYRRAARKYLEEFYTLLGRPDRLKKVLVDGCTRAAGM